MYKHINCHHEVSKVVVAPLPLIFFPPPPGCLPLAVAMAVVLFHQGYEMAESQVPQLGWCDARTNLPGCWEGRHPGIPALRDSTDASTPVSPNC